MKKILSLLFVVLILASALSLTVSAKNNITFSDDLSVMYFGDETFSRFDDSMIYGNGDFDHDTYEAILNEKQMATIDKITVDFENDKIQASVGIYYKDGSVLNASYLSDGYRGEYEKLISGEGDSCQISVSYDFDEKPVLAKTEELKGEKTTLSEDVLYFCRDYEIHRVSDGGNFTMRIGSLLVYEDDYYYVDFEENNITVEEEVSYFYPDEYQSLEAYKITNEELNEKLEKRLGDIYSDDLGFFMDDSFTRGVSNVFLTVVFLVIPFVIFILFMILTIRSKTIYKKFFMVISALSGLEMVLFAIITIYLEVYSK